MKFINKVLITSLLTMTFGLTSCGESEPPAPADPTEEEKWEAAPRLDSLDDTFTFRKTDFDKDGKIKHVSWEELNTVYNKTDFDPIDGRLVRICDHFSALMEADISIKHGITSEHLTGGREGILSRYAKAGIISGINVNEFFQNIVS